MTARVLVPSLALSLAGCALDPVEAETATDTDTQELAGNGQLWPGGVVRVCWETGSADDGSGNAQNPHDRPDWDTLSRVVRDTMRSTWGRAANLEFTGFGDCPSNSATGNPGTIAINMANNGNRPGGETFVGYFPSFWTRMRLDPEQYGGADTEKFRGQVMHETGHALGFDHEWDRADNPHGTGCTVADDNDNASVEHYFGTQFDPHSIMNFSYDQGDPSCALPVPYRLSAWDIVGVQNAYGRRKPGTLVAASGNCLDQPLPYKPGGALQTWECHGGSNQAWQLSSTGAIYTPSLGSYVTVPWGSTLQGLRLVGTGATSPQSSTQTFHGAPSGYQLRGIGDMCLDVPGGLVASGVRPQIYACNGGTNQRWRAYADHTIRPVGNASYCLDVPYGTASVGNAVQLYACNGRPSQQFTFTNAGEIRFGGLCVDVIGGKPNAGGRLQLYGCKSASDTSRANQLWHLTASLATSSGLCLESQDGWAGNGTPVVQRSCTGDDDQTWDYYPTSFSGF